MARILVADDDEGVRSFLVDVLTLDGHQVSEAVNGQQAIDTLGKQSFQVLLTDLKMPKMDGMALLARTRVEHPHVEVIVLTAHGSVDSAVQAMKAGAFDYLQKPIHSPGELRSLMQRAVEHHRLKARVELQHPADAPVLTWGAPAMVEVNEDLRKVAQTDATVLLTGPSGAGKEVAAQAVHAWSRRNQGPFIAVNCAALSESLLEAELFGHERGAFTGAHARRRGRIELAHGGTFFLDEVGELKPALQAKLLRVLQEKSFERVGGEQTVHADVRWIAATNRDLQAAVADGSFREDLYWRLAVFPIELPPLHKRLDDLAPLANKLLARAAAQVGKRNLRLSESAVTALRKHTWPGNVCELANTLERAAILCSGDTIESSDLRLQRAGPTRLVSSGLKTMAEAEREAIEAALGHFDGNRKQAAEYLGIGLRTLYEKLKRYEQTR